MDQLIAIFTQRQPEVMPTTIIKTYRYRVKPTQAQDHLFVQFAGARRFIWNWALAKRETHYRETGKHLSSSELYSALTRLKQEPGCEWLRLMNAQSLQQAIRDLDKAYTDFFNGKAGKKGGRPKGKPRFKSRKRSPLTFRIPQAVSLCRNRLTAPKLGELKLVLHRQIEGRLKSATFTQDASGKWHVTLVCHVEVKDRPEPPLEPSVGIDLGLKELVVTSDGERVASPRHYRKAERKLARLQRKLSRCRKGSRNREKARLAVAKQHLRVANTRKDFLHRISHVLTKQYNTVCIEDLSVSGLAKTKLGKSVLDAGWSLLREQLEYKSLWRGKRLLVIGRFFPSSRLCPSCGTINQDLTLSDRVWTCACGAVHDRDLNAACNIRAEGLRLLLADGSSDSQNASGAPVRLAAGKHGATKEEAAPLAVR